MIVTYLIKKLSRLIDPEGDSLVFTSSAKYSYLNWNLSNQVLCSTSYFSKINFNIIFSSTVVSSKRYRPLRYFD
jgi:hypothetical protein